MDIAIESVESLVARLWEGLADAVASGREIGPHAIIGRCGDEHLYALGVNEDLPKEVFPDMITQAVAAKQADFAVMIHEAWSRRATVSSADELPTKLVGSWPNIRREIDIDALPAIDTMCVSYVERATGLVVTEMKTIITSEDGSRVLAPGDPERMPEGVNRFLDGAFPRTAPTAGALAPVLH